MVKKEIFMKRVKLGDIFELQMGKTPSRNKYEYWGGDNQWVSIADLSNSGKYIEKTKEYITDLAIAECGIKSVPKNTVIMSFKLSIGKTAITKSEIYTNEAIMAFIDKKVCTLDIDYLYHLFSGMDWSEGSNKAVLGLTLNKATLLQKYISIPSLEEQKSIADKLDKVTALIAKRKEQLAKLDQLVKSRFVEMFGDFIKGSAPVEFESVCDFVTVGIANSATHAFCDNGVIMFRNQNIKEDCLDTSDIVYITSDFASKYKSKMLKQDDLLIVRTGYPGVACLVPEQYEGCQTFTTLIARLKRVDTIKPRFVCHYINSEYGKKYVRDNSAGAAQQNFGATALSKLPIYIPPVKLQDEYINFVEQTDKSKFEIQKSLNQLETLKKALMQKYFG